MGLLNIGDVAPDFSIADENGEIVTLNSFKGKKLVLYFYPKDNTPGCTDEACSLHDSYDELKKEGYEVVGVSADSSKSHVGFIEKYNLPFKLLADTEKTLLKSFGAWGEKKNYGKVYEGIIRSTFIISEDGKIERVIDKVKTKEHAKQILDKK
jgi:thioredoxin-dependent peroxiredoxin